jgi:hypothetical protein
MKVIIAVLIGIIILLVLMIRDYNPATATAVQETSRRGQAYFLRASSIPATWGSMPHALRNTQSSVVST